MSSCKQYIFTLFLLFCSQIFAQQIKIGNEVRLGAGSVLMSKPKDGKLYIGNPAKIMEL